MSTNIDISKSAIAVFGATFKDNCPDIRNTKVYDVYTELKNNVRKVDIYEYESLAKLIKENKVETSELIECFNDKYYWKWFNENIISKSKGAKIAAMGAKPIN